MIRQLESKWQEYYHEFEKRAEEEREGNTAMVNFIIIIVTIRIIIISVQGKKIIF